MLISGAFMSIKTYKLQMLNGIFVPIIEPLAFKW
jgi:hypothetical protein